MVFDVFLIVLTCFEVETLRQILFGFLMRF